MASWTNGPPVLVGEKAFWLGSGSGLPKSGIIKWIGHVSEINQDWTVGIELDEALPYGGIDGNWANRVLFTCQPKHGLLVPVSQIIPASKFICFQKESKRLKQSQHEVPITEFKSEIHRELLLKESPSNQPQPAVRRKNRNKIKRERCQKLTARKELNKRSNILLEESEFSSDENNSETLRIEDKIKQKIEELNNNKDCNITEINNGYKKRMTSGDNESNFEETVLDSLYASHHQFNNIVETHSETAHAFVSISSSRKDKTSSGIFSIFRWFRKEKNDFEDEIEDIRIPSVPSSPRLTRGYGSACGSVDTLFSTATASSFAFIRPELYRPFGNASQAEKFIAFGPETETYRKRLHQRDKLKELDQNVSLRKKYNLFGSGTIHRSADDVYLGYQSKASGKNTNVSPESKNSSFGRRKKRKAPPPPLVEPKPTDYSLPNTLEHISKNKDNNHNHYNSLERPRHRRTVSDSAKDKKAGAYCHVRGKRKAPPPPRVCVISEFNNIPGSKGNSFGRKKRPAPPPPVDFQPSEEKKNSRGSLSPDEKQRLLNNIEKLKLHTNKLNITDIETNEKMSNVVSNDSLKLEKGVLRANKTEMQVPELKQNPASPVSPRPWYKRNIIHKENGKSLDKKKDKNKNNDWMPEVGIPRGSIVSVENNRLSNIFSKPDEKRNSQISVLVNISELDREAAEIVKREKEKEKEKLAALNSKFYIDTIEPELEQKPYQNFENENIEVPKKSSARELISLFNAIGNVTKVTVNSAFFSKSGPSIFTKEGIEKRFSFVNGNNDEKVVVQESTVTQTVRQSSGLEPQQTYFESPGVKRRQSLLRQDSNDSSSESSDALTPKVTIEEIEEFDADKGLKTQALYEANKMRKHLSPTIPTIVETSESISSAATSPGSTIINIETEIDKSMKRLSGSNMDHSLTANNKKSISIPIINDNVNKNVTTEKDEHSPVVKSFEIKSSTENIKDKANIKDKIASTINKDVISSNIIKESGTKILAQQPKLVTIWPCPRCTLENPRWRITCEACDMWRPMMDVIEDKISADFPKTIDPKVKSTSTKTSEKSKNETQNMNDSNIKSAVNLNNFDKKLKEPNFIQHGKLTSEVLTGNDRNQSGVKYPPIKDSNISDIVNSRIPNKTSVKIDEIAKSNNLSSDTTHHDKVKTECNIKVETDVDEVRKARLAFFHKNEGEKLDNTETEGIAQPVTINAEKKNTINTSNEERLKIKEMLKEMKNSLPKHSKNTGSGFESKKVQIERHNVVNSSNDVNKDPSLRGAIRKTTPQKTFIEKKINIKENLYENSSKLKESEKAEVYLVKNEIIIEDIRMRKQPAVKPGSKISTSVQTNGVIRNIEPITGSDVGKPPVSRVISKSSHKEVVVPITVEEYTIRDGVLYTSLSKETRRIGTGTFELIRPRDFASIKATKTGNETVPLHVYANVPNNESIPQVVSSTTILDQSNSGSTTASDNSDVDKLTVELTQPKGLAEFKAELEESENSQACSNMNTLALNRILRRLETAIAGGQHQLAASLAKELARLKINCSVTRHKQNPTTKFITVDMFVEDKISHQGPIPLQVSPSMTVAQLKVKVDTEFEIPIQVQRWILGKQLAVDDSMTLESLEVKVAHSPIFLYLVAPVDGSLEKDKISKNNNLDIGAKLNTEPDIEVDLKNAETLGNNRRYYNDEEDKYSLCETDSEEGVSREPSPEPITYNKTEVENNYSGVEIVEVSDDEEEEEIEEVEEPKNPIPITGTMALGWKCPRCTLMNSPTRPGCLACTATRPAEYNIPQEYQVSKGEIERMRLEVRVEKAEAEEKLKHYQQLVNLENADLVVSSEPFDCSICLVNYAANEGIVLRDCLHTFCRPCLAHTVEFGEEAEVKCPFRDDNYACDSTLQEREIKALVTAEVYEQHLAKSVSQAENKIGNAFHCKTPDCRGWCIFEDNVNQFLCPVCNQNNCLTCQAIHKGMNCKQFQERVHEDSETNVDARRTREMLEEMVDRGEAMNCPTCQVILMKKWGCDWLRCSMCKTEICWVTRGPRWGPLGKGDTSGGCQCGLNGVKCHPKCNYCH